MKISESAVKLRKLIDKALENHEVTRSEYDKIIHQATEDAHIDPHEKALLNEFYEMITDKSIRIIPDPKQKP